MEANLKKKLPQEGTGCSAAGESLGEPSVSSCPSYSGGGKDRSGHDEPCNGESNHVSNIPGSSCSNVENSPSSVSIANGNRFTAEGILAESLKGLILTLEVDRCIIRGINVQALSTLQDHVLNSVVIVEKVGSYSVDVETRSTLEKAAAKIKHLLVTIMKKEAKRIEIRSQLLILRRELAEKKEIVRRAQEMANATNITSSESILNNNSVSVLENPIIREYVGITTENQIPAQGGRPITTEQELDVMVQALLTPETDYKKFVGQDSHIFLHKQMLDSVAIIKKIAMTTDNKEKCILENAVCDIKEAVEGLLKLSSTAKNKKQEQNTPECTKEPIGITTNASDTDKFKEIDGEKLTNFLKKYLQNTIDEYLDSCEDKVLNKWEVEPNKSTENNQGARKKIDPRASSQEPIYDVWYEMDQFKEFAMKRIERDAASKKTPQAWFSNKPKDVDSTKDKEQEEVRLLRQQPFWWTAEIAELRRVYIIAKRQYSRSRRRRERDEAMEMEHYAVYRSLKKALKTAMRRAKSGKHHEKNKKDVDSDDDSSD